MHRFVNEQPSQSCYASVALRKPFLDQGGVSAIMKLLGLDDATLSGNLLRALTVLLVEGLLVRPFATVIFSLF